MTAIELAASRAEDSGLGVANYDWSMDDLESRIRHWFDDIAEMTP